MNDDVAFGSDPLRMRTVCRVPEIVLTFVYHVDTVV